MKCHWKDIECKADFFCDICEHQPAPEDKPNGKRETVTLEWEPFIDYCTGKVTGETPFCPSCGEMPYSTERGVFCGQKFIQDEKVAEYNKPLEPVELRCMNCGGKMIGTRAKCNGHIRARCEVCGLVIIE